jgi:hypothetical protein
MWTGRFLLQAGFVSLVLFFPDEKGLKISRRFWQRLADKNAELG